MKRRVAALFMAIVLCTSSLNVSAEGTDTTTYTEQADETDAAETEATEESGSEEAEEAAEPEESAKESADSSESMEESAEEAAESGEEGEDVVEAEDEELVIVQEETAEAEVETFQEETSYNFIEVVNGKGYISIEAALVAVSDGGTIILNGTVAITEDLEISKSVTLNLNGKTLAIGENGSENNPTLTITGGASVTITGDTGLVENYGTIKVDKGTLDINTLGIATSKDGNGLLSQCGGKISLGDKGIFVVPTVWLSTWTDWMPNRASDKEQGVTGGYIIEAASAGALVKVQDGKVWKCTNTFSNGEGSASWAECAALLTVSGSDVFVYYPTVQEAINVARENSATVQLIEDTKESVTIAADQTITLDLNGYTLMGSGTHTIINKGTLTILDSSAQEEALAILEEAEQETTETGTVDVVTNGCAALYNEVGATCTILAGNFTRSEEGTDNSYYTILNHGTMTFGSENGDNSEINVSNTGTSSSMIENGWYTGSDNDSQESSTMIIYGGTFAGGLNTIKNDEYGVLTINGGIFTCVSQHAVLNYNECVINAGSFEASGEASSAVWNEKADTDYSVGTLTISGGSFSGTSHGV